MRSAAFTVFSGGTGTPKLLDGMRDGSFVDLSQLTVVVNTADDVYASEALVCPDLDTVLYTLAGRVDRDQWYGLDEDTYSTHDRVTAMADHGSEQQQRDSDSTRPRPTYGADDEFMRIGDRDRATHLFRTAMLKRGLSLTQATDRIRENLDVEATVLPMTDDPVGSVIHLDDGRCVHLQEYLLKEQEGTSVNDVTCRGTSEAQLPGPVHNALDDPILIGPSNPITSIGPILHMTEGHTRLGGTRVVAVSPFLEDRVFSGPAAEFMQARGLEPSTRGFLDFYGDVLDGVILDTEDRTSSPCPVLRADIRMKGPDDRRRVAREALAFLLDPE